MKQDTRMDEIERATREYRRARDVVEERVEKLDDEIRALKRRRLPGIKSAVRHAAQLKSQLEGLIANAPDLFQRPRTVTIDGVKVGWQKGKGKIVIDDPAAAVRVIRKQFPEQADTLIKVTETPVRKAVAQLSTRELKRIGARVEETGDAVIIKPVDSDVDKLVDALLDEADELEDAA